MHSGFVKVACGTPKIRVADPQFNAGQIIDLMRAAAQNGGKASGPSGALHHRLYLRGSFPAADAPPRRYGCA